MFKVNKMKSNKAGFTLIEVVLVLAIGGLIFLLAFLAFGQATKNRRDTQRRSDGARMISEIENAKGDAGGNAFSTQTDLNTFLGSYLGGSTNTFSSNNITYTVTYGTSVASPSVTSSTGAMAVSANQKCAGGASMTGAGSGDYAVIVYLEKGKACRDNQ